MPTHPAMTLPTQGSSFKIHQYVSSPPSPFPQQHIQPEIRVQTASTWTHVGDPLLPASLPPSFHTWHSGTFSQDSGSIIPLLSPFLEFLHNFMKETHMTHYCLSIRAQKATHEFDVPRWHVDRRFFDAETASPEQVKAPKENHEGKEKGPSCWKVATALLGPGTLFLTDSRAGYRAQNEIERRLNRPSRARKGGHFAVDEEHVCTSFRCLGCADMAESVRRELAWELRGMDVVQVREGEIVVFRVDGYNSQCVGGQDVPAMHSEPVLSEGDRVFVHVVPGREGELRRLVEGWGMEFPRDWFVGVLGDLGGLDGDTEE